MSEETNKAETESEDLNNNDNSASNKADPGSERQTNQIKETGSIIVKGGRFPIYCITIAGEIEGHSILSSKTKTTKYEHVIPQLVSIEEDPEIEGLLIFLNTVGGDIEAGLALAELIAGMKKPSVSLVLGGGHSIGVPLSVSTKKSFIAKSASMTIHPVRTSGLTLGVSQSFEYFQRIQDRITTFVADNSKISKEKFLKLCMNTKELAMDIGTIMSGQDAVNEGLIDRVGNLSDAFTCLYDMIEESKNK